MLVVPFSLPTFEIKRSLIFVFVFVFDDEGKSIRGVPYDWRVGPYTYQHNEFPMMKRLIEDTYAINNNTPVAIISLSMGCSLVLTFFNKFVSQEWKVFIDRVICLFY